MSRPILISRMARSTAPASSGAARPSACSSGMARGTMLTAAESPKFYSGSKSSPSPPATARTGMPRLPALAATPATAFP